MDSLLDQLREEAARLPLDEFVRRRPHPALLLRLEESTASFETVIRSTDAGLDAVREDADAPEIEDLPWSLRWIVKSDRNPYLDRISIGRASSSDLVVKHRSISKLHAHFLKRPGGLAIRDAGSTNGVYVNGERIPDGAATPLASGDQIAFGRVEGVYYQPPELYKFLRG